MDFDKLREENKKQERLKIVKTRLLSYAKDVKIADAIKVRISILKDKLTIGASNTNTEPVQGGGSSQEDKIVKVFDDVDDLEVILKRIELENRAMKFALSKLDNEESYIVKNMWMVSENRMSFRDVGLNLKYSKDTVKRMSDKALLDIYENLYLVEGYDVDVR